MRGDVSVPEVNVKSRENRLTNVPTVWAIGDESARVLGWTLVGVVGKCSAKIISPVDSSVSTAPIEEMGSAAAP